ncbi:hypothetical protein F8M41_005349 [Gigaspora margarita]|uniref:Uncharacterized protein n=1 Tax=Gigaspora margarita TaxID=4874 RepID=A0A8H3XA81_GIGMA|nr:hypothetical protein F8M41_005349 [Gigaspora margarita]
MVMDLRDFRDYVNEIDFVSYFTLEQNKKFFSRLQDLSLDELRDDKCFRNLAKHATKISVLNFEFRSYQFYSSALTSIIKSQEQLRRFKIIEDKDKYHTLIPIISS